MHGSFPNRKSGVSGIGHSRVLQLAQSHGLAARAEISWTERNAPAATLLDFASGPTGKTPIMSTDAVGPDLAVASASLSERFIALEETNRELVEADRRKDEFLAVLAHELRNLMAPIGYAVELMQLSACEPAVVQDSCGVAGRQLHQMVRLVDDLLDVSRIARGKMDLRRENISVQEIIERAVEISRPRIDEMQQRLAIDFRAEPVLEEADATRLVQVLANLLNNASKFSAAHGEIRVSVDEDAGCAVIRVRDEGGGIAASELGRIFEMYTQVRRADRGSAGGLGIGLALAKGIVELHSGSISARSEGLGKGAEFVVRLPCTPDAKCNSE